MINIQIRSLELTNTESLTGVVSKVRTVLSVDGDGMFRDFDLDAPTSGSFIPLENVTDEIVKGWVKPKLEPFIPDIQKRIFQQNEAKKKKAVKQFNPETGETSYVRPEHVNEWKAGMSLKSGESIHYTWETTETYESGSVDEQGNPISGSVVTEHVEFYTVIQDHTSQADWRPNEVAALYTSTFIFEGERPQWKMPQGEHDAYPEAFEVQKGNTVYRSLIPANTTTPTSGSQFWEEVINSDQEPEGIQSWRPYDGTPTTMWNTGEQVTYGGSTWTSLIDNNVWKPGTDPTLWDEEVVEGGDNGNGGTGETYSAWEPYDGTSATIWSTGERVTHSGSTWESLIDNNTWEPGTDATLWKLI